jgi:hypothetical protein
MAEDAKTSNELILASIESIEIEPIFSETLREKINKVGKAAAKIPVKIETPAQLALAEQVVKDSKKLLKDAETIRKSFSGPLDDKKRELTNLEKDVCSPAQKASDTLSKAINAYHNAVAEKARQEAEKVQQDADKKLRRLSNPNSIAALQQQTEEALAGVAAPATGTKRVKKYRILDFNKIPRDLLMIDEAKLKKLMSSSNVAPEGLEFYTELARSGR